ncbi:selenium cofactor biosynthesis protein YqeC [Desulfomonile tiedjei]|uniref:Putative selenium-dependent hydroxylase accessory protein YqeC n=1 Tax=Desulfomonile tiedjei (strain ATCC 49306 / DSM 6799 / DCB-1) TaxID=706587 RepID=I4CEW5_DESTA|nr:selenium cofactor biosynthesis protein YqeC [Desulfomonile tiedjei]AFM28106.1 putative selenium-dependent hydroxylase accessory protein YqeC [Desulfomonile tiedjei DSM 6799]
MFRKTFMECLGIDSRIRVIAITGGGGKTSLMFQLAREMLDRSEKVVTTTTTKIFPPGPDQSPCTFLLDGCDNPRALEQELERCGHITVGRSILEASGKLQGIASDVVEYCRSVADRVLIEADGASGRPIKAPEAWEPVVPDFSDMVVHVIGLDCLGKPALSETVFRLEKFLSLTGLDPGGTIDVKTIARLAVHPDGGLKGVPSEKPAVLFLNKSDVLGAELSIKSVVDDIANLCAHKFDWIAYGSLKERACDSRHRFS